MTKLHTVIIQTRRPSENGEHPGEIAEGHYTCEGGEVVLCDQRCAPLGEAYSAKLRQGEDAHTIARGHTLPPKAMEVGSSFQSARSVERGGAARMYAALDACSQLSLGKYNDASNTHYNDCPSENVPHSRMILG
jgi:hypothetical protein